MSPIETQATPAHTADEALLATFSAALDKAQALGVDLQQLLKGTKSASEMTHYEAARLLCEGLLPVTHFAQAHKLSLLQQAIGRRLSGA
jgi:hypothetical protein